MDRKESSHIFKAFCQIFFPYCEENFYYCWIALTMNITIWRLNVCISFEFYCQSSTFGNAASQ